MFFNERSTPGERTRHRRIIDKEDNGCRGRLEGLARDAFFIYIFFFSFILLYRFFFTIPIPSCALPLDIPKQLQRERFGFMRPTHKKNKKVPNSPSTQFDVFGKRRSHTLSRTSGGQHANLPLRSGSHDGCRCRFFSGSLILLVL